MTDDGRRTPSDGKSSHCLWQGELNNLKGKINNTFLIHCKIKYCVTIKNKREKNIRLTENDIIFITLVFHPHKIVNSLTVVKTAG
jgi:hypothetical protein